MKRVDNYSFPRQILSGENLSLRSFGRRWIASSRCVRLAAFFAVLALALGSASVARAAAGFVTISQLHPYDNHQRTPIISGIEFDNQSNPWVIDGWTWQMQRLDENNGAVLQTYTPTHPAYSNDSLAWSPINGAFYTAYSNYLYAIDMTADTCTRIGTSMNSSFNFMDLAFDPSGKLWLATDRNGGELWSVNTATSVTTFERSITGLAINQQVHALTIAADGRFFIASSSSNGIASDNRIYGVNPQTGAATLQANWSDVSSAFLDTMAIDPQTGRWFGIREARQESPFGYYFVELVDVPEPMSAALLGAAAACALVMFRRRAA
jgi:hypothetical protein